MNSGHNKVQRKTAGAVVGVAILVITLGFVFFLIRGSYAKPSYSFSNNTLTITGQFGAQIDLLGATVTHEHNQVPATEVRTNGAAIGNIEKGYFKIGSSGVYMNVMDKTAPDSILITDKNGSKYYINCASSEETDNLYKEISKQNYAAK